MTREEAILCLKGMKNYARDTFTEQTDWQTSLDMAIKALEQEPKTDTWSIKDVANNLAKHGLIAEQEPCEDAVSRTDVLELIEDINDTVFGQVVSKGVMNLPSVKPQEPKIDMESEEIKILQKRSYLEGFHEALKMSVKQEPCEDAISRQAVIDCFKKWQPYMATRLHEFENELFELPSVNPKKIGHWIIDKWNNKEHYSCSSCQHVVDYEPCYHYCPYCGAQMFEPQESAEPHECSTCKFGSNYKNGYDATTMDDECGGCCTWNDKWQPKEESEDKKMETVKIVIELSEEDYKLALSRAALLGGMLDKKLVDAVRSGRRIEENAISDDGTLTVNVSDGREVNRVLVCGDNHFGGLYYPE